MQNKLQILDCTLRDGGFALEDFDKNGIKTAIFTKDDRKNIADNIRDAKIDIVELGCISEIDENEQFAIYNDLETLSSYIPKRINQTQMFVGLYRGPDVALHKIPEYSPEFIDGIRVILRYSELQKSLDFCSSLSQKGYKVFVQPMLTMRYSNEDLDRVIYAANEMNAYALYFVDSFGYMDERDVHRLFHYYEEKLNPNINIGFHAHNNLNMAFSNVKYFIEKLSARNTIIDSCVIGMGQGAGNLQTEILVNYMNKYHGTQYSFENILAVCDILDKFKLHDLETWGYSPIRLIPAIYNTAYKYAVALRLQYNMPLIEINRIISSMPDPLRHRYTPENLEIILKNNL